MRTSLAFAIALVAATFGVLAFRRRRRPRGYGFDISYGAGVVRPERSVRISRSGLAEAERRAHSEHKKSGIPCHPGCGICFAEFPRH